MKQKTHRGTYKRIKVTKKKNGKGKLIKGAVVNSHNKRKQSVNKSFRKKRKDQIKAGFKARVKRLLNI